MKMEGYTNVIGSQYDFDDLDIEGKVNDEWNAEIDGSNSTKLRGTKVFYKYLVTLSVTCGAITALHSFLELI